jgi:hypothetical protein
MSKIAFYTLFVLMVNTQMRYLDRLHTLRVNDEENAHKCTVSAARLVASAAVKEAVAAGSTLNVNLIYRLT